MKPLFFFALFALAACGVDGDARVLKLKATNASTHKLHIHLNEHESGQSQDCATPGVDADLYLDAGQSAERQVTISCRERPSVTASFALVDAPAIGFDMYEADITPAPAAGTVLRWRGDASGEHDAPAPGPYLPTPLPSVQAFPSLPVEFTSYTSYYGIMSVRIRPPAGDTKVTLLVGDEEIPATRHHEERAIQGALNQSGTVVCDDSKCEATLD